ncbi:type VII secretion protein EccCa [Blastococcus sp. Marseille-P5729]|uniref:type VII secretion protein EccCa n=1 Tax=Blastococcus sp. Marseille-P5729 TaxID=2086582 RepID=UPI000D0F891C|nr:type VII secretion protein EccCa [Blastococcus sp. Marseille-P5729]
MSTEIVRRQPRRDAPDLPTGEINLDPPPELPKSTGRGFGQMLMVLPMLAGAGAMALMYSSHGSGGAFRLVLGGLFGLSALGMLAVGFVQGGQGPSKTERAAQRRAYMRHLASQRALVRSNIAAQRRGMHYRHPDPDMLWITAESHRLWERRREHADFGIIRLGLGPQGIATPIITPETRPLDELEPLCSGALRRFVRTYSIVDELPVALSIGGFSRVHLTGDVEACRSLARAMIAQLAVHHSPDDLAIALCVGEGQRESWEWAKWLPHAFHPSRTDALGSARMIADSIRGLEALTDDLLADRPRFNPYALSEQLSNASIVVIIDGGDTDGSSYLLSEVGLEGVMVLDLTLAPPRLLDGATLVLNVDAGGVLTSRTKDVESDLGTADRLSLVEAEALARQLAPRRVSVGAGDGEKAMTRATGLSDLLGIDDPFQYDAATGWRARPAREQLRVPIGVGPDGVPIELDLKESALDGMGPHGLVIGATGSGKSELLRTLVLALAVTHDPESLNFVLVDFKGGATFTRLDRIPHTSAVITNLADELSLVDRMTDAINGEVLRRQEVLRAAGNFSSRADYEKARLAGAALEPMPSLLLVCDEFSELLAAKPEFIDMFVQIGRVGRSLGIHLLLASQRLEEGRLRGLDTHLSYRIGLRTNSAMESRVVIGSADAFELPRAPGHGYVKYGTDPLMRFRAAYVSGMYRSQRHAGARPGPVALTMLEYRADYVAPIEPAEEVDVEPAEDDGGDSLLDILIRRLGGRGVPARVIWLPPLTDPIPLGELLGRVRPVTGRGLSVTDEAAHGALRARVAMVDRPLEQRRDPLELDLTGGGGNVAVAGGPQSGKSTFLRTFVLSLALTHTPREVQFYCLDFGGGALAALRRLPHVGSVAARADEQLVRRTIAELRELLARREQRFAADGIDGMATYRRQRAGGAHREDAHGDVFLIVDGWHTLRTEFEGLDAVITDLAARGLSYGIHVVVAATRWMDVRQNLRDVIGTKLELRLGDPSDSVIGRRQAISVPDRSPGRGLTPSAQHLLVTLPRIDGRGEVEDLTDALDRLVESIASAWDGRAAPQVRLLPLELPSAQLALPAHPLLPIGISEDSLRPVYFDPRADSHLVVYGDGESGKTAFLRAFAHRVTEQFTARQAKLIIIDYRRTLLGEIDSEQLLAFGSTDEIAAGLVNEVCNVMRSRLPGTDVTPEQLRARDWWKGPDLYLMVDDYDLVATATSNPLAPLAEFLAQARDIGLHLIVTRRSGGAARASYDPLLGRLRELAAPGIVMSGSKDEGALVGNVKPQPLPPGRGWYHTRKSGAKLVQLEWRPLRETGASGAVT